MLVAKENADKPWFTKYSIFNRLLEFSLGLKDTLIINQTNRDADEYGLYSEREDDSFLSVPSRAVCFSLQFKKRENRQTYKPDHPHSKKKQLQANKT